MRCDEVRELLPEELLGSLDDVAAADVRRHLRGCAGCREERDRLQDGIEVLSLAIHEEAPPQELREQILGTLREEWDEAPEARGASRWTRRPLAWVAAAAVLLLVLSGAWGLGQHREATLAQADAESYRTILRTLGGRDFRLGEVSGGGRWDSLEGQVVVYDGDTGEGWTSWILVFLQGDERGTVHASLSAPDGRTLELRPMTFTAGEAYGWLVTHEDVSEYDVLTLTGPHGTIATARIHDA